MCTLVVAAGVVPARPRIFVANRDEVLGRASSPPRVWDEGFLAPRDDVAGGTWLGVNREGVFVGITNRFGGPRDPARQTRGELVTRALTLPSARAIHDAMKRIDPARYNGFHLVYVDEAEVLATVTDGRAIAQLTLGEGLHVITERSFGAGDDRARVARVLARWDRVAPGRLVELLTEHDVVRPLDATCVHAPEKNYGTRSATVVLRTDARWEMLWAEGPPCTTPFTPVAESGALSR